MVFHARAVSGNWMLEFLIWAGFSCRIKGYWNASKAKGKIYSIDHIIIIDNYEIVSSIMAVSIPSLSGSVKS